MMWDAFAVFGILAAIVIAWMFALYLCDVIGGDDY